MIEVAPVTLERDGVRLEPLGFCHAEGLRACAQDGELWKIRVTSVPEPENVEAYIGRFVLFVEPKVKAAADPLMVRMAALDQPERVVWKSPIET